MTEAEKKKRARAGSLRRKYNLTLVEYDKILKEQGGVCAGCGRPPSAFKVSLAVDHDHSPPDRKLRGILCVSCNELLPNRLDLLVIWRNLLKYLEDPPATKALGEIRSANPMKRKKRKSK